VALQRQWCHATIRLGAFRRMNIRYAFFSESIVMSKSSTTEFPSSLRFEIKLLSVFIVMFGVVNQVGWLLFDFTAPSMLSLYIPAGAVVLPGVFLIIAGMGVLLKHEWGFKLACILYLIHLTSSAVWWHLTVVEFLYVIAGAVGAFESWRVLSLSRRITNRST
jgi:hypothetical protein